MSYLNRCNNTDSRVAAYELIIELANRSLGNLKNVCSQLIEMHHLPNLDCTNDWEVGTMRELRLNTGMCIIEMKMIRGHKQTWIMQASYLDFLFSTNHIMKFC